MNPTTSRNPNMATVPRGTGRRSPNWTVEITTNNEVTATRTFAVMAGMSAPQEQEANVATVHESLCGMKQVRRRLLARRSAHHAGLPSPRSCNDVFEIG